MNDPGFITWAQNAGLDCGPGSQHYDTWFQRNGLDEAERKMLSGFSLKSTSWDRDECYIGSIWMYCEETIMSCPDSERCLASRILPIGGCGNGDHLAVDMAADRPEIGFLNHEQLWSPDKTDPRTAFVSTALSFTEFHGAVRDGAELFDYYSAKEFMKNQ